MNILFISFYFDPFPGVGAKRVSYWAKHIHQFGFNADVITAMEQKEDFPNARVFYVPLTEEKGLKHFFIKDAGVKWKDEVKGFIQSQTDLPSYDAVVISGGPFMHMELGDFLKKRFGSKILLDFRDPFAVNPRFNNSVIKRTIKKYFEQKFISMADGIITVNQHCLKLLSKNEAKPTYVIENGFDEDVLGKIKEGSFGNTYLNVIHTGSYLLDRNPTNFLKVIESEYFEKVMFHHFGNQSSFLEDFENSQFLHNHGFVHYEVALENIAYSDLCLIFTSGFQFESTTKIFDYMALNKKVLIITEGEPNSGNLEAITKDYPNVFWARNNEKEISFFLKEAIQAEVKPYNAMHLSRKASLEKLVKIIKA
ncbi:MAG: hypothetical protein H0X62_09645 [Bacteroidetes bacterium]|nr:hypothetical protein [Bacteroidota bacterium]